MAATQSPYDGANGANTFVQLYPIDSAQTFNRFVPYYKKGESYDDYQSGIGYPLSLFLAPDVAFTDDTSNGCVGFNGDVKIINYRYNISYFSLNDVISYTDLVESNIKPLYDNTSGSGYFQLSDATKAQLESAGYEEALNSCDKDTYNRLLKIVTDDAYPKTGYYRIKNPDTSSSYASTYTDGYISLGSNTSGSGDASTGYGLKTVYTNPTQDASTVIHLTLKDTLAHTYTFSTQNVWAMGAKATTGPILMTANEADATEFTINAVSGYPGTCDIKQPTLVNTAEYFKVSSLPGDDDYPIIISSLNGNDNKNCRWEIEAVADGDQVMVPTLHAVGGSYYATLNLPYGATVEGASAHYASLDTSGESLSLTEIAEIPANTPVVLIGDAETAVVKLKSDATAEVTNNALTGNYFPITWTPTNLSLGSVDDIPGFYPWEGTTLGANKAYYVPTSKSVRGLAFYVGDETTDLQSAVTTNATNGNIFDLQGRRVLNAKKGLYVVGGKKVLVK